MSNVGMPKYVGKGWTVEAYDEQYLYVVKEGRPGVIQIKADEECFVLDVFVTSDVTNGGEPTLSTYVGYDELKENDDGV